MRPVGFSVPPGPRPGGTISQMKRRACLSLHCDTDALQTPTHTLRRRHSHTLHTRHIHHCSTVCQALEAPCTLRRRLRRAQSVWTHSARRSWRHAVTRFAPTASWPRCGTASRARCAGSSSSRTGSYSAQRRWVPSWMSFVGSGKRCQRRGATRPRAAPMPSWERRGLARRAPRQIMWRLYAA